MAASGKQEIGNPLDEAAASGILGGGQRKPIGTRQDVPMAPAATPERPPVEKQQAEAPKVGRRPTTRERKKKTVLLEPDLARWLDIQSASESRELSDIVADGLELYKKFHSQGS